MDATGYNMRHCLGNTLINAHRTTAEVPRPAADTFYQFHSSKGSNHE